LSFTERPELVSGVIENDKSAIGNWKSAMLQRT
jgi:hypothetical protein